MKNRTRTENRETVWDGDESRGEVVCVVKEIRTIHVHETPRVGSQIIIPETYQPYPRRYMSHGVYHTGWDRPGNSGLETGIG